MVLKSQGWRYNKKGFEEVFLPLSETCNDPNGKTVQELFRSYFLTIFCLVKVKVAPPGPAPPTLRCWSCPLWTV